jgi:hypothetical protein
MRLDKVLVCTTFTAAVLLSVTATNAEAQCTSYTCPQCFNDSTPLSGHGAAPDGSGRRALNVFIDSSWGNPTNTTIWNATNDAINAWNALSDPSCNGRPGTRTAYYYVLNQAGGAGAADVVVQLDNSVPTCGQNDMTNHPYKIQLHAAVASTSESNAKVVIEHELGHAIGLDDTFGACVNTSDIMSAATDYNCNVVGSFPLTPGDVGQSNRNLSQESTCTGSNSSSAPILLGGDGCTVCADGTCLQDAWCDCGGRPANCQEEGNLDFFCSKLCTPIVLDPFNEGFHLTSVDNGVKFRVLPGGSLHQMSWTDASWRNGWLALDRNGNGTIDDFTEMFGNITTQPASPHPNGFLALAVFDNPDNGGNGNGFIDPGDSVYSRLRVWIDANHNGISEPSELYTLQELGIFKLGLAYKWSSFTDQYGNQFRYRGSVWDDDGNELHMCYDVLLQIQTH